MTYQHTFITFLAGLLYFIPTPPATSKTLSTLSTCNPGGGQTKLPPTRTSSLSPSISFSGRHSHAAGGFCGDAWIASSRYPSLVPSGVVSGFAGSVWAEGCLDCREDCRITVSGHCKDCGRSSGEASRGVEVIVKPPGLERPGICTSSHWPGRNYCTESLSICPVHLSREGPSGSKLWALDGWRSPPVSRRQS